MYSWNTHTANEWTKLSIKIEHTSSDKYRQKGKCTFFSSPLSLYIICMVFLSGSKLEIKKLWTTKQNGAKFVLNSNATNKQQQQRKRKKQNIYKKYTFWMYFTIGELKSNNSNIVWSNETIQYAHAWSIHTILVFVLFYLVFCIYFSKLHTHSIFG